MRKHTFILISCCVCSCMCHDKVLQSQAVMKTVMHKRCCMRLEAPLIRSMLRNLVKCCKRLRKKCCVVLVVAGDAGMQLSSVLSRFIILDSNHLRKAPEINLSSSCTVHPNFSALLTYVKYLSKLWLWSQYLQMQFETR